MDHVDTPVALEAEPHHLPEYYDLQISDPEETGIRLFQLTDKRTGVVVTFAEFNPHMDVHAFVAWVAARISRAGKGFDELFAEIFQMVQNGLSTGQKLAEVFNEYGHASVFDMVPVFLYIDHIPQIVPEDIFNETNMGGAQQESTRFVRKTEAGFEVTPIETLLPLQNAPQEIQEYASAKWAQLRQMLAAYYDKWFNLVNAAYIEQFGKVRGLKNRTTDIARTFLPSGSETSVAKLDMGRNWLDIARQLKASSIPISRQVGEQIITALKLRDYDEGADMQADLITLAKYDQALVQVKENMETLKYYLLQEESFQSLLAEMDTTPRGAQPTTVETITTYDGLTDGMMMVMQYVQSLYPLLEPNKICEWLMDLKVYAPATLKEMGSIIMYKHHRHNPMNNLADVRSSVMHVVKLGFAYLRDLERQRAAGRVVPMLETDDFESILNAGFNDLYQFQATDGLMHLHDEYVADMENFYAHLRELFYTLRGCHFPGFDESFILHMLPLGHHMQINMTFPAKQDPYFFDLRGVGLRGGDYGYMHPTHLMWKQTAGSDPVLEGMFESMGPLDPNDPEEFMARG